MVACRQVEPVVLAAAEASLESGSAVSGHGVIAQLQATTPAVRRSGIPPRLDTGFDATFNMLDSSLADLDSKVSAGRSNGGLHNAAGPLDNWCTEIGYQP